jgi:glycosyltransferase involved in cell wall biosynthesis
MRVIYFVRSFEHTHSGVSKKIISQIASLNEAGVDTKLFTFGSLDDLKSDAIISDYIVQIPSNTDCDSDLNIVNLLRRDLCINRALRLLFESLGSKDIIYSRIPPLSISTLISLRKSRTCKVVFEFQSIENREAWSSGRYFFALLDSIFGKIRRRNINGIVGVTDEITAYQLKKSGDDSIPHITIGNGFEVQSVSVRQAPHYNNDLHLLCVANVSRWHGLDRLLRGLAAYCGMPNVILHIAGDGAELPHLQKLAGDLGISDRVVFHGFTTGKALDALFDQCHIAVGSLGIHRKGLTQTSELKGREYCARGIPFIVACADPDFPPDFPYIHHLPADESPIEIEEVLRFAKVVCADPDHPQKMRRYAEEHLDWSVKMKRLKGFLETLIR